ncbi:MAG: hypothetical protein RLZZ331_2065 [Pseudomonadota bacterium]|uniref:hypothetical protein n=1 Tax=Sandarakinorhabdus limnophila TaxID=210512 RepID=UPI0026F0E5F9|nr:hypothetical protein [Sandarakinorhabdus limnophila]
MKLVIVYNANEGLLAGAMDSLHKLFAPATYLCKLCALTYGLLAMRREWRAYLDGLAMEARFHHRPDFRAAFPQAADWPLPLIAVEQDGQLAVLISAADFASIADLSHLMMEVDRRLPGAARLA